MNLSKKLFIGIVLMAMILPVMSLQAGTGPNDPRIRTNKTDYYVGDQVTVTVDNTQNGNIQVIYCLLETRNSATNPNKKWTMYKSSNASHYFTLTDAWANKWLKIIANNTTNGGWSDEIYIQIKAKTTIVAQSKQTLAKPQWIKQLPSNVTINQDYPISWTNVANAQKYRVYFTQNGRQVGYDYLPTGTSQTVKIPNVTGTVYIAIIAMPSDYNKYNQSDELNKSFTVSAQPQPNSTPPPTPPQSSPASATITYPSSDGVTLPYGDIQVKGTSTASVSTKIHLRNTTTNKRVDIGAGTCDNCGKQISTNNSVNNSFSFTIKQSQLVAGNSYRVTIETINGSGTSTWKERTFTVAQASSAKITSPNSDGQLFSHNDVTVSGSSTAAKYTKIHLRNTTTNKRVDIGAGSCDNCGKQISTGTTFSFTIPKSSLVAGNSYNIAIETVNQSGTSSYNERTFKIAAQETVLMQISDNGGVWYGGKRDCKIYLPKNEAYIYYKALTRPDWKDFGKDAVGYGMGKVPIPLIGAIYGGMSYINGKLSDLEKSQFAKALDKMDNSSGVSFICVTSNNFQSGGLDYANRKYEYVEKSQIKFSSGQFISMSKLTKDDLQNFFFKGFNR
jgi:hypothetical protein